MPYKDKICIYCDSTYTPTAGRQKQCQACRDTLRKKQASAASIKSQVKAGKITKPGVGSGNNQKCGKAHPRFSSGRGFFEKQRPIIRKTVRYCERCSKDLRDVGRYFWCVHHRDHDPHNNVIDNFELLCKSCHEKEHKSHERLFSIRY